MLCSLKYALLQTLAADSQFALLLRDGIHKSDWCATFLSSSFDMPFLAALSFLEGRMLQTSMLNRVARRRECVGPRISSNGASGCFIARHRLQIDSRA